MSEFQSSLDPVQIFQGRGQDVLAKMADNRFHALVCDAPYGMSEITTDDVRECLKLWLSDEAYEHGKGGFMGEAWDKFVPGPDLWRECFRVLRPGAFAVVFASGRTVDLMGVSLRLAGFEVRSLLGWIYGTGQVQGTDLKDGTATGIKSALEPIILARKPFKGTVKANVAKWGTGALRVGACMVPRPGGDHMRATVKPADTGKAAVYEAARQGGFSFKGFEPTNNPAGSWPTPVLLQHAPGCEGDRNADGCLPGCPVASVAASGSKTAKGTAARYFNQFAAGDPVLYCGKPSRRERDAGLEHLEPVKAHDAVKRKEGSAGLKCGRAGAGRTAKNGVLNHHKTVKPVDLMAWLINLVSAPGQEILDCCAGSGTTGIAAALGDRRAVLIDMEARHIPLIEGRVDRAIECGHPKLTGLRHSVTVDAVTGNRIIEGKAGFSVVWRCERCGQRHRTSKIKDRNKAVVWAREARLCRCWSKGAPIEIDQHTIGLEV